MTANHHPDRANHTRKNDAYATSDTPVDNANYQCLDSATPENQPSTCDFACNGGGDSPQLVGHDGNDDKRPARGYKWADATPGNVIALKHGAHSLRYVNADVEALRPIFFAAFPWIEERGDIFAVDRFLHKEIQAGRLRRYIDQIIEKDGVGAVPDGDWKNLNAADAQAAKFGDRLGLDPTSRARLQQAVAPADSSLVAQLAAAAKNRTVLTTTATTSQPPELEDGGSDDAA